MRHAASSSLSCGKLLLATILAVFLQAGLLVVAASVDDSTSPRVADEDNLQVEGEMPKREWNRNLNMWGKRGWSNLHGGWGVKRSEPSWLEQNVYSAPPIVQKRAWNSLQGGWGKRVPTDNEDLAMQQIASLLEENDHQSVPVDPDFGGHDADKRNWVKFTDGWGKRNNKWENFRGEWGKREPAWVNLKGLWG